MIWNLFKKGRQLSAKLAESLINNHIDDTELDQWQKESIEARKLLETFADPNKRYDLLVRFEQPEKKVAVQRLYQAIRRREHYKSIRKSITIAAAVALFIGSNIMLYSLLHPAVKDYTIASITPGYQQATLILANGEKIKLSRVTQIEETDGTAIRQTQPGEIYYHPTSTTEEEIHYNTIIVPRYGEYAVVLSDGTRIKLNAESELRYPTTFSGNRREVFLKGEAYLEVSKNGNPFIVHAYEAQIKVYGTRFDIDSYDPDKIQIVLVEGKVSVSDNNNPEVFLLPDQLAQIETQNGITIKKNINPEYYIAWQNGYFAFEEERLEDIMITLSRWYNFEVLYSRPELREIYFTASISREQPLQDILQQFQKTGSISYRTNGSQIIIQ